MSLKRLFDVLEETANDPTIYFLGEEPWFQATVSMFLSLDVVHQTRFFKTFVNLLHFPNRSEVANVETFVEYLRSFIKMQKFVNFQFESRICVLSEQLKAVKDSNTGRIEYRFNDEAMIPEVDELTRYLKRMRSRAGEPLASTSTLSNDKSKLWLQSYIETRRVVAIDVEYLQMCELFEGDKLIDRKLYSNEEMFEKFRKGYHSEGFRIENRGQRMYQVSIVDLDEKMVLNRYVRTEKFTFRTYSRGGYGYLSFDRKELPSFEEVRHEIIKLCEGKLVLFWDKVNDLKAMNISEADLTASRDIQISKGNRLGLKHVVKKLFNQDIQVAAHDSLVDSIFTMRVFKYLNNPNCKLYEKLCNPDLKLQITDWNDLDI